GWQSYALLIALLCIFLLQNTGESLFRNMYRDFLKECLSIVDYTPLQNGYILFTKIAPMWEEVSKLINKAGETHELLFLNQASDILLELSNKEYEAMNQLSRIC
ncbi:DUF4872 domain-containing protein, partial [Siminovitchia fortis]